MLITTYFLCTWAGVQVMACKDKNKGAPPTPEVLIRTTQSTSEEDGDTGIGGGESNTDLRQILHTLYG